MWRPTAAGPEICVVHRPSLDDWSLPKGKLDGAEHTLVAAVREVLEETGVRARVTGFLGIWITSYADVPDPETSELISVAYYHAEPLEGPEGAPDPAEVAEARWFAPDMLPQALAPPGMLDEILIVWRDALAAGRTATALPDRPRSEA